MQNNPFFEKMNAHPDAKLIEIVTLKRSDYQPEAIAAAEYVLNQRNVPFEVPVVNETPRKKRSPAIAVALGSGAIVVAIYLVGFAGRKTGIPPSYIILGCIAFLCLIWFFFGIRKGRN